MDLRDLFALMKRYKTALAMIVLVSVLLSIGYTAKCDPPQKQAILFLTLGLKAKEQALPTTYVTNESHNVIDQFTETVQGWLLDPNLKQSLEELSSSPLNVAFRKQEKQNLVVTLQNPIDQDIEKTADVFLNLLQNKIKTYNQATNTSFVLAMHTLSFSQTTPHWGLNAIVGALLGWVFGLLALGTYEYVRRRVSFVSQVESILGNSPFYRLNRSASQQETMQCIENLQHVLGKSVNLIEMGTHRHGFGQDFSKAHGLKFNEPVVFFIELGKTSEDDLRQLKLRMMGDPIHYVIIF